MYTVSCFNFMVLKFHDFSKITNCGGFNFHASRKTVDQSKSIIKTYVSIDDGFNYAEK